MTSACPGSAGDRKPITRLPSGWKSHHTGPQGQTFWAVAMCITMRCTRRAHAVRNARLAPTLEH